MLSLFTLRVSRSASDTVIGGIWLENIMFNSPYNDVNARFCYGLLLIHLKLHWIHNVLRLDHSTSVWRVSFGNKLCEGLFWGTFYFWLWLRPAWLTELWLLLMSLFVVLQDAAASYLCWHLTPWDLLCNTHTYFPCVAHVGSCHNSLTATCQTNMTWTKSTERWVLLPRPFLSWYRLVDLACSSH